MDELPSALIVLGVGLAILWLAVRRFIQEMRMVSAQRTWLTISAHLVVGLIGAFVTYLGGVYLYLVIVKPPL